MRLAQVLWLAPRNLFIAFIKGWRKYISPIYGDVCRYHPTCSAYGLGQVQQRGLLLGSFLTAWRILRCNPLSRGGFDPVSPGSGLFHVREDGFVEPQPRTSDR
jgi:hypothetical protein